MPAVCLARPQYVLRSYCDSGSSRFPGREADILYVFVRVRVSSVTLSCRSAAADSRGTGSRWSGRGAGRFSQRHLGMMGNRMRSCVARDTIPLPEARRCGLAQVSVCGCPDANRRLSTFLWRCGLIGYRRSRLQSPFKVVLLILLPGIRLDAGQLTTLRTGMCPVQSSERLPGRREPALGSHPYVILAQTVTSTACYSLGLDQASIDFSAWSYLRGVARLSINLGF